jgi:hypothetical protein
MPSASVVVLSVVSGEYNNLVEYIELLAPLVDDLSKVSAGINALNLNKV